MADVSLLQVVAGIRLGFGITRRFCSGKTSEMKAIRLPQVAMNISSTIVVYIVISVLGVAVLIRRLVELNDAQRWHYSSFLVDKSTVRNRHLVKTKCRLIQYCSCQTLRHLRSNASPSGQLAAHTEKVQVHLF